MSFTIVAVGPGDPESVPAAALDQLRAAPRVRSVDLDERLADVLPALVPLSGEPSAEDTLAATDRVAWALARRYPRAQTVPERTVLRNRAIGAAVARLAEIGAHLRIHCPWDREQTAATIVPHTVEEAFEVAEAVHQGDADRQADEIGDLLFQSVFLAQLLEESAESDLARIAQDHGDKLIARHPHVYADAAAEGAAGVRELWEANKRAERGGGVFHEVPEGLPALAYATKTQKRADAVGFDFPDAEAALQKLDEEVEELRHDPSISELGDVLFAVIAVARRLRLDPEIAVRLAAQRFRERVERAEELARREGIRWTDLGLEDKEHWYQRAKDELASVDRPD